VDRAEAQHEQPVAPTGAPDKPRRNRWIWISALLAVVSVALLVWALTVKSDGDSTQDELESTQQELTSTQQKLDTTSQELDDTKQDVEELQSAAADPEKRSGGTLLTVGALATAKALYDDLAEQLGATQEDLATVEQDVEDANDTAKQAEQDAEAAKKRADEADNETDVAKAEADQAKAELKAAESKAAVAADCARAYVTAFGALFEGKSVRDQAAAVRKQFATITTDCKGALADA
jgi:cell division protein FtsL